MNQKIIFLTCMCLLASCSSEPSQSDIEKSVKNSFIDQKNQVEKMLGNRVAKGIEIYGVKKIACKKSGEGAGYNCDVEIDATDMLGIRNKTVGQVRMVKSSDGWIVVK